MEIKGFVLENEDKVNRVILGTQLRSGRLQGGLGEGAPEEAILAHYDKLGGFITKNGAKVQNGCFWDFKNQKPFEDPKVFLAFQVNGSTVVVPDNTELPGEVKAAVALSKKNRKKKNDD